MINTILTYALVLNKHSEKQVNVNMLIVGLKKQKTKQTNKQTKNPNLNPIFHLYSLLKWNRVKNRSLILYRYEELMVNRCLSDKICNLRGNTQFIKLITSGSWQENEKQSDILSWRVRANDQISYFHQGSGQWSMYITLTYLVHFDPATIKIAITHRGTLGTLKMANAGTIHAKTHQRSCSACQICASRGSWKGRTWSILSCRLNNRR